MIAGMGIDLVEVASIAEHLSREAYLGRAFTDAELAECRDRPGAGRLLAGKFAAKEAFMKAIGQGIGQGVWFTQIEILTADDSTLLIKTCGQSALTLAALGVSSVEVSITHTGELVAAVVILVK